jgi:prevent-host-death family protein
MITETNAVAFRQNLGEMINQVQYRRDSIVINKDGRPVAVLIDTDLFERIRRLQGRFDELAGRFAEAFADVPAEEGAFEIEKAVAKSRGKGVKRTAAGSRPKKG